MSPDQIIAQLHTLKPLATSSLQREALAWTIGKLLHQKKEIQRVAQEQKRAEEACSTTENNKGYLKAIVEAHEAVSASQKGSSGD